MAGVDSYKKYRYFGKRLVSARYLVSVLAIPTQKTMIFVSFIILITVSGMLNAKQRIPP